MPLPSVPDPDQTSSLAATASAVSRDLEAMLRAHKRDRARIRNLPIFHAREQTIQGKVQTRRKAQVEFTDRPEVEMIIARVDEIDHIKEQIAFFMANYRAILPPRELVEAMKELNLLRKKIDDHYTRIEAILANLAKEHGAREATIAAVAMKMAALAQQLQLHEIGAGARTDKDIIDRLKQRYNLSDAEAQAMLDAKPADGPQ